MKQESDSNIELKLNQVADRFIAQIRDGQFPSIEEYKRNHPELASDIEELFPTLAAVEKYDPAGESGSSTAGFHAPTNLGEYRVVREIARGGMGVVYEAYHDTMRRHVALKVLPRSLAKKQNHLDRFIREARAAGQLHHTNIVPVFEVGQSDGVHYYAMQYIHGQNLDVVIDELRAMQTSESPSRTLDHNKIHADPGLSQYVAESLLGNRESIATGKSKVHPTKNSSVASMKPRSWIGNSSDKPQDCLNSCDSSYGKSPNVEPGMESNSSTWTQESSSRSRYFRRVARTGIQVADALEFAHSNGILHRDIKPSNLILDSSGTIWVTDFGLAKNDGDNLTHTGDIIGTLRYMAPERFRGDADARSDVYSLGLTLYELCTMQCAFDQSDRAKLIQQVTTQTPIPPRRQNAEIPIDLETVILKAIAREPASRYQSARELSEDLQRFVADRPVKARRVSFLERAWRWSRRHPTQAALTATIVMFLGTLLAGSIYLSYLDRQHATELADENDRFREAVYQSKVESAHAQRTTGEQGQRSNSLTLIAEANEMLVDLKLPKPEVKRRKLTLRNSAIQSFSLRDVRSTMTWAKSDYSARIFAVDPLHQKIAWFRESKSDNAGEVCIAGARELKARASMPKIGLPCWILEFSNDGRLLYGKFHLPGDHDNVTAIVWDTQTNKELLNIQGAIQLLRFSSDSQKIAVLQDNTIDIYDRRSKECLQTLTFEEQPPLTAHFARRDECLVIGFRDFDEIQFWKWADEIKTDQIPLPLKASVDTLDWNEQRNQLAVAIESSLYVWPPADLQAEPEEYTSAKGTIRRVSLSTDGRYALSWGWDGGSRLIDLIIKREVLRINHRLAEFRLSSSKMTYRGINDFGVMELPESNPLSVVRNSPGEPLVGRVQFHPGYPELIAVAFDSGVEFWNHKSNCLVGKISMEGTTDFLFGKNGECGYICCDKGLARISIETTREEEFLISSALDSFMSTALLSEADVNAEHGLMAARYRKDYNRGLIINLTDFSSFEIQHESRSIQPKVSPCGRFVISRAWGRPGVRIWNPKNGKLIRELGVEEFYTPSVAIGPFGKRFTLSSQDRMWTFDSENWQPIVKHSKGVGHNSTVAYSPQSRWLVTAYDLDKPVLIDYQTDEVLAELSAPNPIIVGPLTVSPNNQYVASIDSDKVYIWNLDCISSNLSEMDLAWD